MIYTYTYYIFHFLRAKPYGNWLSYLMLEQQKRHKLQINLKEKAKWLRFKYPSQRGKEVWALKFREVKNRNYLLHSSLEFQGALEADSIL